MIKNVEGRYGKVFYFAKDEYVGKSLHNYGEYNPDETEFIVALAAEAGADKVTLDIGANFGVMGQALEHAGFKVISFEPQPEIFKHILVNNVLGEKHNCGLGDVDTIAQMPKVHYSERNNFGGLGIGYKSTLGSIDVEVRTLDSFHLTNIGLMKIDVEGYEEKVLRGATETIARCRPIMYIEDDRHELSKSLREFVVSLGYTIEEHKPELYRENNFFGLKKNVWDRRYASHNIVCRPC